MSAAQQYLPQKIDLTPRRHHGYAVLLFIMGTLLPPLAVAARFGVGKDFWINIVLTICGYIPGHGHNFYIQNIRNNKTHARTPKWVQKYGLVDTSEIKRKERKSQWARRYNDRLPRSALEGQPLEEGQEGTSSVDLPEEGGSRNRRQANGELWRPEDETYYNPDKAQSGSSGRWHYPANFDDVEPLPEAKPKKKKKSKKDRWERTQDAYSMASEVDSSSRKKKKKRKSSVAEDSISTRDDGPEYPEDPEGGLYGERLAPPIPPPKTFVKDPTQDDVFNHQF